MRAVRMVVGEPERDRIAALFIAGEVISRIEAFALERAVEAFHPSVGPGVVGTGPRPAHPDLGAGRGEAALVSDPVVGEHPADADPLGIEMRNGAAQEGDAVRGPKRRPHLEIGLPPGGVAARSAAPRRSGPARAPEVAARAATGAAGAGAGGGEGPAARAPVGVGPARMAPVMRWRAAGRRTYEVASDRCARGEAFGTRL